MPSVYLHNPLGHNAPIDTNSNFNQVVIPPGETVEVSDVMAAELRERYPFLEEAGAPSVGPAAGTGDDLSALKLADLRARAKAAGLSTAGTKADLVERLTAPPSPPA